MMINLKIVVNTLPVCHCHRHPAGGGCQGGGPGFQLLQQMDELLQSLNATQILKEAKSIYFQLNTLPAQKFGIGALPGPLPAAVFPTPIVTSQTSKDFTSFQCSTSMDRDPPMSPIYTNIHGLAVGQYICMNGGPLVMSSSSRSKRDSIRETIRLKHSCSAQWANLRGTARAQYCSQAPSWRWPCINGLVSRMGTEPWHNDLLKHAVLCTEFE
jgi:hypothetical protein